MPHEVGCEAWGQALTNRAKTHCPAGHAYNEKNTYRDPSGSRRCRACTAVASRKYYPRRKARQATRRGATA